MSDQSDWRDRDVGRTGLSLAHLTDGESLQVRIIERIYDQSTSESDHALHIPCQVVGDIPNSMEDMSGDDIDPEKEYNIINSSSSFFQTMKNFYPEGTDERGDVVEITAHQPGDEFSRYYTVEEV